MKTPGPDHPITLTRHPRRVVVEVGGKVLADTGEALSLQEAGYKRVLYIPRRDVDMTRLERTDHSTYCPYKGDCSYYSIPEGGERTVNVVWSYERPFRAVEAIEAHLAFYPDRVTIRSE